MNIIKVTRFSVLISYILLIAFMLVWHFQLDSESALSDLTYIVLFIVPLLIPLKGIWRGNPYTHAWSNFVILLYMCHGLTVLWVYPEERYLAIIELVLVTICFFGSTYYAKYQGRALGLGLKKNKDKK